MHTVAETTANMARKAKTMTRIAGSGSLGLVTLANTLTSAFAPKGIVNHFTGQERKIPGFSTATALNLFTPMENVIAQKNLLIEQQTVRAFLERQEQDARDRLPAWARATRRLDDNVEPRRDLKQRAQDLIAELNAKFQPDDSGAVFSNRNPSADNRPGEGEVFPSVLSGYTVDGGLSLPNMPRMGLTSGTTLSVTDLADATMSTTPEKVLVRLDSASRDTSEGGDNSLKSPAGRTLDLNGTTLDGNTVHELTYAEYQQLTYTAGTAGDLDYLSVIGVDETNSLRGEMVTSALSINEIPEHRIIGDTKVYELDFLTEKDAFFTRFEITFDGTFANKEDPADPANSFMGDLDAGDIEITIYEAGNIDNKAFIVDADSVGDVLAGSFGSNLACDGLMLRVDIKNFPAVDINSLRVKFS